MPGHPEPLAAHDTCEGVQSTHVATCSVNAGDHRLASRPATPLLDGDSEISAGHLDEGDRGERTLARRLIVYQPISQTVSLDSGCRLFHIPPAPRARTP